MPLYRKKPVVIEAERFLPDSLPLPFSQRGDPLCYADGEWHIETLEGPLKATSGDWIIKGIKGEFYPCKPDIFAATYEPEGSAVPEIISWVAGTERGSEA